MSRIDHGAPEDGLRRRAAAREAARTRVGSITMTVALGSAVTAAALAVTLPGTAGQAHAPAPAGGSPTGGPGAGSAATGSHNSPGFSPSAPPAPSSGGGQVTSGGS